VIVLDGLVSINGPVPALNALRVKSWPAASTTLRETIMPARSTSNDSTRERRRQLNAHRRRIDHVDAGNCASSPLRAERRRRR